jgi:hypothetical protein
MSRSGGLTFKRCGCRDQRTGRQLGQRCPHLGGRGHGSWYLAIGLSVGPDGRRRRVRLGGFAARAAAQAALGRLGSPGGRARCSVAGCTTGQWLVAWLAGRQSLRASARRSYQHHLDTYLLPRIGTIPLAMLTAADLRVMFTAIGRQRPGSSEPVGRLGLEPRTHGLKERPGGSEAIRRRPAADGRSGRHRSLHRPLGQGVRSTFSHAE